MLKARQIWLLPAMILMLHACKKENADYTYDYRRSTDAVKESSVRLVNLSPNTQLIVNGDSLTNFYLIPRGNVPQEQSVNPGTKYFPVSGLLTTTWRIPQNFIKSDGTAHIKTSYLSHTPVLTRDVELTVKENAKQAVDYYLTQNSPTIGSGVRDYVEVPRDVTAPSKPDHFKIRVLNLSIKLVGTNPMEDISSAYTLTYADGTPLSAATTNVQAGDHSAYIEVPYGTYQFKLLTSNGRQVPASYSGLIVPSLSTMPAAGGNGTVTSGQIYAPVQTYQPGGIYTIVVHPSSFTWSNGVDDLRDLQNCFRVIADISEPVNNTYARVQVANALPESQLQLRIQGKNTPATAYSTASDYQNVVKGKQLLQVVNTSGQVVASQEAELLQGGNYTLWAYPDAGNGVRTVLVSNSLSGTTYIGQNNDGGNAAADRLTSKYFFNLQFLNFIADLPYVTFTNGQGNPNLLNISTRSGTNLQPGIPLVNEPYARLMDDGKDFYQIMAYASAPGKVPGDWLSAVTPINSRERLVARPALYTNVNRKVPAQEPGVYSIALVGRQNAVGTAASKLMIVKHTK